MTAKIKNKLENICYSIRKLDEETIEKIKKLKEEKADLKKQEKEVKKLIRKNTKFSFVKKFIAVILILSMMLPAIYQLIISINSLH